MEPLQKAGFRVDAGQNFQEGRRIPVTVRTWKARKERLRLYRLPAWRQKLDKMTW